MVLLETALWPSIGKMPDLQQFLATYPEAMRKLFNLDDFGTGTGFVNAELSSALVPVPFLTYAIGRGARSAPLALAVGAVTGRRGMAIGVAAAGAVAAYLLYVAGELVASVEPWQPLSPFSQALSDGPVGAGFRAAYLLMPTVAAVVVAAAMPLFARRDIAVAH
ncbi:hypothetical protein [Actinoplanes sp. NPDC049681]|uniref:hypothetical protein n=1 Tax=Actinoplanes sp. NPDC049681 TaxID=3363905 RepID=UPI00379C8CAA